MSLQDRLVARAAMAAASIALLFGVPTFGVNLVRRVRWADLREDERARYRRWLKQHRKRLWGRDFDDHDGRVIDRVFQVTIRTGDDNLPERVMKCVRMNPDDQAALAEISRILDEAEDVHRGKLHPASGAHA